MSLHGGCSFQRLDLALVNPGTVQTILGRLTITAAGGSSQSQRSDGDLTAVNEVHRNIRDWIADGKSHEL